jgi:arginyl-tRNA synthetase
VLTEAHETNSPNKVANYVFQIAKLFSQFYDGVSVLNAGTENQKNARLKLSAAAAQVITNSLDLLGIEVPQKM